MGQVTQVLTQADFSGGVNAVTSPYLLTKKQIARVRNMILDHHGFLSTRDGYSVVSTAPSANPVIYHDVLNKNNGSSTPFAIVQDTTSGNNLVYNTSASPWTLIGTLNSYDIPQTTTVSDQLVIACGNNQRPHTWSGSGALTPITASAGQTPPAGAKHLSFHLGSLWLWNTNTSTTTLDGPSSLRMSDVNNVNSWPNANQTFVSKDDGQQGMGMATYTIVETGISPTSTLVLFKNYSAYQVTGVFGSSNFGVQKVKSDMGCVAPRTIQFVSGFGVIRLTHKGFALYNGVDDKLISEEIRPYILGHEDIFSLSFGSIERAWAVQAQNPPLYIAACPVAGSGLNRIFVFDLVRRAWTICDFPVDFASLTLFATPTLQPTVRAGTTNGKILSIFSGDTTDNGHEIDWSFRSRSFFMHSSMRPAFWRRAVLDLEISSPQSVTFTPTLGAIAASDSMTKDFLPITSAGATYGSAVYGTSLYSLGSVSGRRASYDIMRTAPTIHTDISGSGNVKVRGLEFHGVAKKPTRMEVRV